MTFTQPYTLQTSTDHNAVHAEYCFHVLDYRYLAREYLIKERY